MSVLEHLLHRWIYVDLWIPLWPNLIASALCVGAGLWWHHSRIRDHISAEFARLRENEVG